MSKNNELLKLSTYATVLGVFLIITIKIYGWYLTQSMIILASLIDSCLDAFVSVMNLFVLRYALIPADNEHRFGHTKIEDIAVLAQSVFLGLSAIFLIYSSLFRFYQSDENLLHSGQVGLWIMMVSLVINFAIILIQNWAIRTQRSSLVESDSLHYMIDLLTNIFAIVGFIIATKFNLTSFDNITAILMALYMIYAAVKFFKTAFNNLMDHEFNQNDKKLVIDIIKSFDLVLGFHDLKTRTAGTRSFIQFHLELDPNMTLSVAHNIAVNIEKKILDKFPNSEIIIHQDPEGVEEQISYKD